MLAMYDMLLYVRAVLKDTIHHRIPTQLAGFAETHLDYQGTIGNSLDVEEERPPIEQMCRPHRQHIICTSEALEEQSWDAAHASATSHVLDYNDNVLPLATPFCLTTRQNRSCRISELEMLSDIVFEVQA
jgi:hypothetical protein